MRVTPCKDCQERFLGCHDTCEKYLEWKKERQEIIDKKNEIREIENAFHGINKKTKSKLAGVRCHKK